MSPNKKAAELFVKFSNTANSQIEGKRCAIICVEFIIEAYNREHEYWNKVIE